MKQAALSGGVTVTYSYDALGRRIQRSSSVSGTTKFVYDGADVVRDLDSNAGTIADYVNGPGVDNKLRQTTGGTTSYFVTDHLGTTRALADAGGNITSTLTYDSFGNVTSGSASTRYTYTGRETDADTGLMYYRARWYDPQQGRFISEDPIGFNGGDVNVYAYVGNRPIRFSDPSGLWSPEAHESIIESAFKNCLSEAQRQKLKDASAYIDGFFNRGQSEAYAYQHGMRGGPKQSEQEARNAAENFMTLHEQLARNLAPSGCEAGYQGISGNALYEFGQALHTITDMTSPSHEGFQIWYGPPYPSINPFSNQRQYAEYKKYVLHHEEQETLGVLNSDPVRRKRIIQAVREAFAKTFGDCGCCSD